jgi:hypothetical protein
MGSLIAINKDRVSQQLAEGGKGGGGGGGGPDLEVREQFADTAYWRADLVSDENGVIQFSRQAARQPDDLGADGQERGQEHPRRRDDRRDRGDQGTAGAPGLPRFFTAGDRAMIGGVVVNFADSEVSDGVFTFAVEGARWKPSRLSQLHPGREPGDSASFAFPVSVDGASDVVTVTMTAQATTADGATLTDGVRIPIPVRATRRRRRWARAASCRGRASPRRSTCRRTPPTTAR